MISRACEPNQIDAFLSGEMSGVEEADFTRHLDECETCGKALEQQAGRAADWQEAKSLLADGRTQDDAENGAWVNMDG